MQSSFIEVLLLDFNLKSLFYRVPDHLKNKIDIGMLVSAPLKGKITLGFVINFLYNLPENFEPEKVLEIIDLISDTKYFDERYLKFFNFTAHYYCAGLADVINSSFPKISLIKKFSIIEIKNSNLLDPVMDFISKTKKCTIEKILKAFPSLEYKHIFELEKKGFIKIDTGFMYKKILPPLDDFSFNGENKEFSLNDEQKTLLTDIIENANKSYFCLLTGKTGTGKTEVLIKLSKTFLESGKSVLYLVPEIALASHVYKKISDYIGKDKVFLWHSSLSQKLRGFTFEKITESPNVVIGTRSSIFLPVKNPGLIIVDEEHDSSYKQEGNFSYNSRDLAIARGMFFSHPVVLASATPSMESLYKAKEGNYKLVIFSKRYHPKKPDIIMTDNENLLNGFFSPILIENIKENLSKGEQSLIFINRRGYVPYVYCNECKNFIVCNFCTVPLTWHKKKNAFSCHKCGFSVPFQNFCLSCKSENISFFGAGTEKIAELLSLLLPSAKIIKIDRESTDKPEYFKKELSNIVEGRYDIIVATQILTKGHHFPKLTLVGVLLGDQGLNLPDFRAQERTFQLLTQVFGRTGRELPGRVIIQTSLPDAPAIKFAIEEDVEGFYNYEIQLRKQTDFPPIKRLLIIKVFSKEEDSALKVAEIFYKKAKKFENIVDLQIFEPLEAPIYREKGYYKLHIYCKSKKPQILIKLIKTLKNIRIPKNVRAYFDIDPLNLL